MRTICVDAGKILGKHRKPENFCISASRAYTLMLESHREHIRRAVKECGFRYLRFHGLFQDDLGIYREDAYGNPVWGWQYADEVYDFLRETGVRPFVVLDFMPEALRSGEKTVYWEKAGITPPKDWEKWYELVYRTACHFRDRYGEEEVSRWFFEVWNEPDGFFWTGTREEYFRLYELSAKAVKKASPRFRIGGPAVAGESGWIDLLAAYCREKGLPLDFITAHTYCLKPFEKENVKHPEPGFPVWKPGVPWKLGNGAYDPAGGAEKIGEYRAAADRAGLPLYITEFGLSYDYWDPIRDSYEAASWLLSRFRAVRELANAFSVCELSDVFEEDGPPTQNHFHGGFGLVNLQGIRKPAYFAFRYLNLLLEEDAACSDARAFATVRGRREAAVLLYDDAAGQTADNKAYFSKLHCPRKSEDVRLSVENLEPGRYTVELSATGYRKNDAYTAFLEKYREGRDSLSREEVAKLREISDGSAAEYRSVSVTPESPLILDFTMAENDVWLVRIFPEGEEAGT